MLKIVIFILSFTLFSCSSERPKGQTEAEVLFKESKMMFDDGKYIQATEKLNNLKSQYPYSYYAKDAELLLADILFVQENYVESASAYLLFREMHPKSNNAEYVIWRIAESYFNQLPPTFDRDLSMANEAIKYYQELVDRFPSGKHTVDAKEKIKNSLNMIQDKEKYIADFYFKTDVFDAARYHYLLIIDQFKDESLLSHSMKRILQSSYELGEFKECQNFYKKFLNEVKSEEKNELTTIYQQCRNKQTEE